MYKVKFCTTGLLVIIAGLSSCFIKSFKNEANQRSIASITQDELVGFIQFPHWR